jgi:hypothetical protein
MTRVRWKVVTKRKTKRSVRVTDYRDKADVRGEKSIFDRVVCDAQDQENITQGRSFFYTSQA